METMTLALPSVLRKFAGSIMDVDGHEMMPAQVWVKEMGDVMQPIADYFLNSPGSGLTHPNQVGYEADLAPIEPDTIWKVKGNRAPGATDMHRRLDVLDMTGIKRQLMFPGVGLLGLIISSQDNLLKLPGDYVAYGKEIVKAANEWAVRTAQISDRVRPVVTLIADTPEELLENARDFIDRGIRAVWLPSSIPPGGKSPAHPDLDPLWALLAEKNVALTLHVGLDNKVGGSDVWKDAPAFEGFKTGAEFSLDPWTMLSIYLAAQNMVKTMVMGGVFERHPMLRLAVIETGGFWIGPLCEHMDMHYRRDHEGVNKEGCFRLAELPSFYVKRNIRVSGYDFEPMGTYIERYGLEDVFCFATDYPHIEGGRDPANAFYNSVSHLGEEAVEKFFLKNAEWVLPD